MATIKRLTHSCLLVTTDDGTSMIDPGFHTFEPGVVDLDTIGDVQRVLITHEHADHVQPEFVRWLVDRGDDVRVYSNDPVKDLLARHDIEVETANPEGVSSEDVTHEMTPMGSAPPNRVYTIDGVLSHPGDSYQQTFTAPVLALPLLVLWGSTTESVEFAKRLGPKQVIPAHDFYVSGRGRQWVASLVADSLRPHGIEMVPLDWGESYTV